MANNGPTTIAEPGVAAPPQVSPAVLEDSVALARRWALENAAVVRIIDPPAARDYIHRRQELGMDRLDEVWDGVYVVSPLATNPHQDVNTALAGLFFLGINLEARGRVLPGANVSDRREGWEGNYRVPDIVVVLNEGRAVDCGTHWMGGPDFLTEVRSPGDDTEEKLPFYSGIGVRELLVVHRDTRDLRLYRHDGQQLMEVTPAEHQGGRWLVSRVIPFAFRREVTGAEPRTEVLRTDDTGGSWVVQFIRAERHDGMFGYHGRYLRIDLARGTAEWVPLAEDVLRRFIGGVGLATWLMHRECPRGIDPLAPAAPLVFSLSPLVGTPLTTSAKFAVVAKSPLTDRLNDALSSSHFALAAKRAGCDAIVLTGACAAPSVLLLDDGRIDLRPAADLWGLPAPDATEALRHRFGPHYHAAVIGPAGENLVRYATISHDNRHAGRGGLGAVMGSKRLKALAAAGTRRVEVADPQGVVAAARDLSRRSFGPATAKYRELGTVANLLTFNRLAALPTRNFQQSTFEGADALSGEGLNAARRVARASCASCTIGCEHIYEVDGGRWTVDGEEGSSPSTVHRPPSTTQTVRLEYESLFALGPLCGIADRDAVLRAARLCDCLGLDTISAGATVAFAMECGEKGLLREEGLRFGNADIALSLLERVARRDGLGDLLAEGTRRAAAVIGGEAPDFAPHVKGLEIPGYEPRALQTMALGFAVGSRGADHNRSGAYEVDFSARADRLHGTPDAARLAVETEDRAALMDSLILCKFLRGVFDDLFAESAALLRHVTGWDVTAGELREAARRVVTAKKLFNVREGWTPAEDTLPRRFLSEGLASGASAGAALPRERLDAMIRAYYAARGWDDEGRVPSALLAELRLTDLATEGERADD